MVDRHINPVPDGTVEQYTVCCCILKWTIVQRPPAILSFLRLRDSQRCQVGSLKCLHIDIASLSNQVPLILPSKASSFLG